MSVKLAEIIGWIIFPPTFLILLGGILYLLLPGLFGIIGSWFRKLFRKDSHASEHQESSTEAHG